MEKSEKKPYAYSPRTYVRRGMEIPVGESETVPDDTLSIKELVRRFQAGMPIGSRVRDAVYNGGDFDSDDLEKVNQMDITRS